MADAGCVELVRAGIQDAERAGAAAAGKNEGTAGIEPDAWLAGDQGIVGEACVEHARRSGYLDPDMARRLELVQDWPAASAMRVTPI